MMFLQAALAAQLENENRARMVQQNRRAKAREQGRYVRGNRPPYGYRYAVTATDEKGRAINWRLEHDPNSFPTRRYILTWYQQGMSFRAIADLLTQEHVPTSHMLAHHKNAPTVWNPATVRHIVLDPLNEGEAVSYRYKYVKVPPDAKHKKTRWLKRPADPKDHIPLPAGTVEPSATPSELMAIKARHDARPAWTRTGKFAHLALLHGAIARHTCGGGMAVSTFHQKSGSLCMRYQCRRHGVQPALCADGLSVDVHELDGLVWGKVREILLTPGALHDLAEQQAQLDLGGNAQGELERLKRVRQQLHSQCNNLIDGIANAPNEFTRALLTKRLAELEPEIEKAEKQIGQYEALLNDQETRRLFMSDLDMELLRYQARIEQLDINKQDDIKYLHTILVSLGTTVKVARREDRSLAVDVDLNLRRGIATPWFPQATPEAIHAEIVASPQGQMAQAAYAQAWERIAAEGGQQAAAKLRAYYNEHPEAEAEIFDLMDRLDEVRERVQERDGGNTASVTTTVSSSRRVETPSPT